MYLTHLKATLIKLTSTFLPSSYHAGEKSQEGGKEFDSAYLGFKEHIEALFAQYLHTCYCEFIHISPLVGIHANKHL